MVIAVAVVLIVVVVLATGRGGQQSVERAAYAPLDLGPVSATDVALLRPPSGLWGYSVPATDSAMEQIAEAIRERDVRIVALEQLVTDLSRDNAPAMPLGSPYFGARHRRPPTPDTGLPRADPAGTAPAWADPTWERSSGAVPEPGQAEPAWSESAGTSPAWSEPGEPGPDARPAWSVPADSEPDWVTRDGSRDAAPAEEPQLPAEPGTEGSGPPPERSHD